MNLTDQERKLADSFKRTKSYAETGRELGISRQAVYIGVLKLKVKGVELPESKAAWRKNDETRD